MSAGPRCKGHGHISPGGRAAQAAWLRASVSGSWPEARPLRLRIRSVQTTTQLVTASRRVLRELPTTVWECWLVDLLRVDAWRSNLTEAW
jgi:hypothetical protein